MIQLDERHQAMLREVLHQQLEAQSVYVYGSRAVNRAKPYSDIDLCLEGESRSFLQMAQLQDALSESDLPYFVDVIQKNSISDEFYNIIQKDFVAFNL